MLGLDGRYIPRLYFLKNGDLLAVDNKKNYPNNAFYFPQLPDVIKGMTSALELYEKDGESKETEQKIEGKTKDEKPKKESKKEEETKKKPEKV